MKKPKEGIAERVAGETTHCQLIHFREQFMQFLNQSLNVKILSIAQNEAL